MITLVASAIASGFNGGTTGAVNTTGANFLIASVASYQLGTPVTVSDSMGNTWTPLTAALDTATSPNSQVRLFYCANAVTGAGHTFTVTGATSLSVLCVSAFSGVATSSPFDSQNGAGTNLSATVNPGSVTPGQNGELIVTGLSNSTTGVTYTIGSSFTITNQQAAVGGATYGGAMGYLVQGSAAAVNPTWGGWPSTDFGSAAVIACFKAQPATANGRFFAVL